MTTTILRVEYTTEAKVEELASDLSHRLRVLASVFDFDNGAAKGFWPNGGRRGVLRDADDQPVGSWEIQRGG